MNRILSLATVNLGPIWLAEVSGSCCLCFSWKVCTGTGGQRGVGIGGGDFLQGLREKGSARGCGNVLLWKDFKPNPRLVTKCRLRGAVSVPAAHLHPQPGLAEGAGAAGAWARAGGTSVLELMGSFPREEMETPFRWEGICFWPREVKGWKGRLLLVPELEHEVSAVGSW